MRDADRSAGFQSIHTLQRRLGEGRSREEHPYESVINGMSSLRTGRRRRRLAWLQGQAKTDRV